MIRRWLVGTLAVVGALACLFVAVALGFVWLMSRGDTVTLDKTVVAPDKAFSAVVATAMGGGAAGSCATSVYVFPRSLKFDSREDQSRFRVAWLRCAPFELTWTASNRLRIAAEDPNSGVYEIAPTDESGAIIVSYHFGRDEDANDHGV